VPEARLSPLADLGSVPEIGSLNVGLRVSEHRPLTLLHLQHERQTPELRAALASLDCTELPRPGFRVASGASQLMCIGPSIYLLVEENGAENAALRLDGGIGRAFSAAVDLRDAWTRLVIVGDKAADLLSTGCVLDFHPRAFPPERCAATGMARMHVIVTRVKLQEFHLLIGRSYALSLWEWLSDAAAAVLAVAIRDQ